MSILSDLLFSELRAEIFRLLFGLRDEKMYRAEIMKLTGFKGASVEEELAKLMKLELLVSTRDGNRVYYAANKAHPLYADIRSMVLKTVGLHDVLANALTHADVQFAFVFGSLAALNETARSDVDLMVVGTLGERALTPLLRGTADQLGREVNPHLFTPDEISRRARENDHFLRDVLSKPRLFLVGDEHEFDKLAQRRLDPSSPDQP